MFPSRWEGADYKELIYKVIYNRRGHKLELKWTM